MNCKRCKIKMEVGQAIEPAVVPTDEGISYFGSYDGVAPLTQCWKCPKCGYSVTIGIDSANGESETVEFEVKIK